MVIIYKNALLNNYIYICNYININFNVKYQKKY